MAFLLLPVIALGHVGMHIAVINRMHGTALPRWSLKLFDAAWYLTMFGIPIAIGILYLQDVVQLRAPVGWPDSLAGIYLGICVFAAVVAVVDRVYRLVRIGKCERLVTNHTHVVSIVDQLGHRPVGDQWTSFLSRIPFNEILHVSIHEKHLELPRLEPTLCGFRITHLSDLHLTGQLDKDYYGEVVRLANQWPADIVAITGDIVEKDSCLDWIADTLGRLEARVGVFFVLGNHELRIKDESRVRRTLSEAGLIDAGKRWQMISHAETPMVIAGNELPWFPPAADFSDCPAEIDGVRPLRILLTHSPDQWGWARHHDCDLMLAGHTHGGQVRLPLIGPILSPSQQGSRFASGTFYNAPTLMHVSRGIAGTRPLRVNCPPELARLVLK